MQRDGVDVLTGKKQPDAAAVSTVEGKPGTETKAALGAKSGVQGSGSAAGAAAIGEEEESKPTHEAGVGPGGPDWDFKLRVPDLVLPFGKLTTIIGSVAAGKSSLLAALLGEMTLEQGSIAIHLPAGTGDASPIASAAAVPIVSKSPKAAETVRRNPYEIAYCA